ncbi:hypothetical protein SAMN05421805_104292 [Saccharopolyspora antimicrobica]|uniref:Uncharacterized protein n=1 Tax=Saccharopolyspora antimicrobica TaxID=455193 RepID=A0A1I4YV17_9PSEU|nr:hypothetical protein [Saccharopolyspora antimicrobica]RKT82818.1 hypothetical protein ATL45_1076 [Saccharopolyspora antimicrobica]SFN41603.1 hypothetical protein SAMN05421805_104292 [Saccharopolyspora antimicrobica]
MLVLGARRAYAEALGVSGVIRRCGRAILRVEVLVVAAHGPVVLVGRSLGSNAVPGELADHLVELARA